MPCVNGVFKEIFPGSPLQPFVLARLFINDELKGDINFLIDTGADVVRISFKDVVKLGLENYARRKPKTKVLGVSGIGKEARYHGKIELELYDSEGNTLRIPLEYMDIALRPQRGPDFKQALQLPSLLGWNALKDLELRIDYKNGIIQLCKH